MKILFIQYMQYQDEFYIRTYRNPVVLVNMQIYAARWILIRQSRLDCNYVIVKLLS